MKKFINDETGASLTEYALLLMLASLALVGAIQALRTSVVGAVIRAAEALGGAQ